MEKVTTARAANATAKTTRRVVANAAGKNTDKSGEIAGLYRTLELSPLATQ